MSIKNPQTWTRLKRIELRQLANWVGNEAIRQMELWPRSGEGRAVKATTEVITRRLDGHQIFSDLEINFSEIESSIEDIDNIRRNSFYISNIASIIWKKSKNDVVNIESHLENVVEETLKFISDFRASLPAPLTPSQKAVAQIADIVPEQKIGPVKFAVTRGMLRVQHQASLPSKQDAKSAESARLELMDSARQLNDFLYRSNYDRRLSETIADILKRLEDRQDVIQLGIAAISCQLVCERFEEELPSPWSARLQAFAIGTGMYVAQFPDWLRFSENAAVADYNSRLRTH